MKAKRLRQQKAAEAAEQEKAAVAAAMAQDGGDVLRWLLKKVTKLQSPRAAKQPRAVKAGEEAGSPTQQLASELRASRRMLSDLIVAEYTRYAQGEAAIEQERRGREVARLKAVQEGEEGAMEERVVQEMAVEMYDGLLEDVVREEADEAVCEWLASELIAGIARDVAKEAILDEVK